MQIQADERAQSSRKLAQKLLKEFSNVYRGQLHEASPHQLVNIMEKFTSHGWMIADTYNSIIEAFGKQFDKCSFRELGSFCSSLGKAGLRQGDIISEIINRIDTNGGFPITSEDGT